MIKMYTGEDKLIEIENFIKGADYYFDSKISNLTLEEISLLNKVEKFSYLGNNKIETPYGVCSIYELSTGSKTIINILRNPDKVFDATGCGENALIILFEQIDNTDIKIVLRHGDISRNVNFRFEVNDKYYNVKFEEYSIVNIKMNGLKMIQ